ncbi:DUF4398 domain-containing protein [Rhodanobacter sp. DHG33]|nr:DUF4398 domain-containing protein [Rhodanobacter sp. DHG33]
MVHISLFSTRRAAMAGLLAGLLALAGCASVPPPNDAMNQAQTRLQAAHDAGAADYDPVDLGFAQDKFQQAQAAMADRKYALAADLAAESGADADLARTKANLGAARSKIQSKMNTNAELRQQGAEAAAAAAAEFAKPLPVPSYGSSAPAPASSAAMPAPNQGILPPAAPVEDMPAPSASALAPPPGQGFQTTPQAPSQNQDSNATQGFQPAGGQP